MLRDWDSFRAPPAPNPTTPPDAANLRDGRGWHDWAPSSIPDQAPLKPETGTLKPRFFIPAPIYQRGVVSAAGEPWVAAAGSLSPHPSAPPHHERKRNPGRGRKGVSVAPKRSTTRRIARADLTHGSSAAGATRRHPPLHPLIIQKRAPAAPDRWPRPPHPKENSAPDPACAGRSD